MVVVCAIVIGLVIGAVGGLITGGGMMAAGGMGRSRSDVQFDKDSPMGKLQEFGKSMEEAGKKAEAAQKSGNKEEQLKVAMEGLGAMVGGGKRYEPLGIDELKPFVPETLAGLPKTARQRREERRRGPPGLEGRGELRRRRRQERSISRSPTLAVRAGCWGSPAGRACRARRRTTAASSARARRAGAWCTRRPRRQGGANEFTLVLGDRFVVSARGQGVSLEQLKGAVNSLDLGKLESMKEIGAQPQAK